MTSSRDFRACGERSFDEHRSARHPMVPRGQSQGLKGMDVSMGRKRRTTQEVINGHTILLDIAGMRMRLTRRTSKLSWNRFRKGVTLVHSRLILFSNRNLKLCFGSVRQAQTHFSCRGSYDEAFFGKDCWISLSRISQGEANMLTHCFSPSYFACADEGLLRREKRAL